MAKRQFELTEPEIGALRQAEQQTRDVHELRRLQAVRLYGRGISTREIANVVGLVLLFTLMVKVATPIMLGEFQRPGSKLVH